MFDLDVYLKNFLDEAKAVYGESLLYVGLQGSYLRGEAHENSDIDVMVVIDGFCVKDMDLYKEILNRIDYSEKSCGFICGKEEINAWTPLETLQLLQTTKDLYGNLEELLPKATRQDEITYVKTSLGNLYHELCHRYIHTDREKNRNKFRAACKGIFFLLQNLHYLESGVFAVTKEELRALVSAEDRIVLSMADLPEEYDFERMFRIVFEWLQNAFVRIDRIES